MVRRDKTNYVIQSVAHSLDVLEQFFGEVDELGVTELSKRLKLHKNNVFRLLATLEARGYIEQNKSSENYRLGIKCLHLGRRYIHHMGLVRQARPILAEVAQKVPRKRLCRDRAARGRRAAGGGRTRGSRGADHSADRPDVAAALHGDRQGPSGLRSRRATEVDAARTAARAIPSALSSIARSCSSNSMRSRATAMRSIAASSSKTWPRSRCRFAITRARWSDRWR